MYLFNTGQAPRRFLHSFCTCYGTKIKRSLKRQRSWLVLQDSLLSRQCAVDTLNTMYAVGRFDRDSLFRIYNFIAEAVDNREPPLYAYCRVS